MRVSGGCHCGAIRFSLETSPNPKMLDCNCSICRLTGYLHLFIPHEDLFLECDPAALTSYQFGSGQAEHLFCKSCGIKSFYQPRSHPGAWSVNFKCLDENHRLTPRIVAFDGRNWDQAKAKIAND